MFSKAVSASLARKGKFGILWLAATVGSHERSLPKTELIKINLSEACESLIAAEPGGAPPTPSPSASSSEQSDSDDEDGEKKRKRKTKTKKKKVTKKRKVDEEKVVIGLRLSANLMLGVCRVYDLQVTVTSSDATQLFLGLRPMLNEYNRGGKAGVAGGPRRLDMADDFARPNKSNLDAPEEPDLLFGYAHGFGNPEWDVLEPLDFTSLGKLTSQSSTTRTEEEDEDDGLPQARPREGSMALSASRINLNEPFLPESGRGSQAPEVLPEFEPGPEEGLHLLDDDMMMDLDAPPAAETRLSSSALVPGMNLDDQPYPQDDNFFDLNDVQPMDVDQEGQPRVPSSEDVTESSLSSILKPPGAPGPKRKKTVKLAKMDAELTFPDSEIKDWRKTYVKKMIDQGHAAKEKHAEKNARDAAVALLQQVPAVIGIQAPEMINFLLGPQNKKKTHTRASKPRVRRKKRRVDGSDEETSEEIEEGDDQQRPADLYPPDDNFLDMNDVQPMDDEHRDRYIDYTIPLPANETTVVHRPEDDDESETGRKAPSSRKSSSAPWDSVQRRNLRDSSIGPDQGGFLSSSQHDRASTGPRMSFAADSVLASRRHRRDPSRISSGGRSASVDRHGGARTDDGLEAAYPEAEMLQEEGFLPEDEEVVSTFSLERQSFTFLEYLRKMVLDLPRPTPILNEEGEDIAEPFTTIPFSKLAPIEDCTTSAAAKGFYQILVLATKDLVGLLQEDEFGEILVTLKQEKK